MKEINILHLSDLHISNNDKNKKEKIITQLINDCKNNINENIDFVFFTGDFVFSGEISSFDIASGIIELISKELSISTEKFIYIPGNHEVNTKAIKSYYFSGLSQENTKNSWEHYCFEDDQDLCHQIKEYLEFQYSVKFDNDIVKNIIYEIDNLKIGITAINSSWFSKGKTNDDRGKIFVPAQKISKSFQELHNCEFKVAIMHHPYNFFNYEFISDVEKELGKYDLVLSGHMHADNIKIISNIPGNKALFITGNELNDTDSNGYAFYKVSLLEQKIYIKMRKYYKSRNAFDSNNELVENGSYIHELSNVTKNDKNLYDLFIHTKNKFIECLDNLMITNILDTNLNNKFTSSFILPKLTTNNHEKNYETSRSEISFEKLFDKQYKRIILTGKKEVGKTVLANYIALQYYNNFIEYKKIPVIVNCNSVKGDLSSNLINIIKESINNYADDEYSISNSKIRSFLENDNLVLIFDDFPKDDSNFLNSLNNLDISKLYILMEESITSIPYIQTEQIMKKLNCNSDVMTARIEEFTKNQIRNYSKSLLKGTNYNVDQLCSRTVSLFNEMSLPKTPFAVSLFISICSINSDFEPTNKSKIIEKLIEILLEKLSPNEIYLKSYGFDSKCSFLSSLAYDMYCKNQYYYTTNDFMNFVIKYHNEKMFPLDDTKFDKLFFEKNILIKRNNKVMFRFKCFINYFLALYFSKNYDEIIELASSEKYYNYDELFEYYSGINKGAIELVSCIDNKYDELVNEVPNLNEIFNLTLLQNELFANLTEESVESMVPLCDEEKDDITDIVIKSDYDPMLIDMSKEKMKTEKLLYTIHILGSIIKNSEDFTGDDKIKYLKKFMTGCICLTAKIFDAFKEILLELKGKILAEQGHELEKEKKLEKAFDEFSDIVKLTIPLFIQEFILETVGTRKLKTVIEKVIECNFEKNSYELLNYICLYADLRIENWDKLFIKFIEENNNFCIKSIILLKCYNYLEMNYFNDDSKLCKKVMKAIHELNGYSKSRADNLVEEKIKSISLKNMEIN